MNKTAFTLILLAGAGLMCFDALAQGPVVSRTETTYTKDNEIIMDGYTPLDEIDNSVKTSVKRYNVPQAAQAPVQQPRPSYVMPVNAVVPVQAPVAQRYQVPQGAAPVQAPGTAYASELY